MAALPTLMALRCFDASARLGSFTRAADEIHLTQGAVSHQILMLERLLGVQLFLRKRGGLELTGAGRAYHAEVAAAVRQIARATDDLVASKGRGGTLNLSVASSFASYWLVPRLSEFVQAHPEVTLNLTTKVGPLDFRTAPNDASIEYCTGASPEIMADFVLASRMRPYASPAMVRKYAGSKTFNKAMLKSLLAEAPLIRYPTAPLAWPSWLLAAGLLDDIPQAKVHGGPVYELLSMALNGVIGGIGVALLPRFIAQAAVDSRQAVCLSDVSWTSEEAYHLRYPMWKQNVPALATFRGWLTERAAADAALEETSSSAARAHVGHAVSR